MYAIIVVRVDHVYCLRNCSKLQAKQMGIAIQRLAAQDEPHS